MLSSYYGGITRVFKIGKFKGIFKYIDFVSKYPAIMHDLNISLYAPD